jgi:intein-encoded DNA endonuclease-like protein
VLYHLKKNGISRRDKAEHIRRVTPEMVDGWVKRYEAGESLKQIAGNEFSPVTVFLHLRKRGMKLRDKVDAQIQAVTKFRRTPFGGDVSERAYVLAFVWGDCSVEKHGRAIRVRSGTTHPEFVNLFKSLFSSHGQIRMYPKLAKVTPAEWNLEVDLDGSFEFLLEKNIQQIPRMLENRDTLLSFVAGFADAEGTIYLHRKTYGSSFEFHVSNTNLRLLERIKELLSAEGYHPRLYRNVKKISTPEQVIEFEIWKLSFHRFEEVKRLLMTLPLRHKEKVTKARLALSSMNSESPFDSEVGPEGWREYLAEIERERQAFIEDALRALSERNVK